MISPYDYAIIVLYLASLPVLACLARRFNRGSNDYFAGGFRMAWWMLGASSFISNFSCWLFTGAANIAYTHGVLIFGFYAIDVLAFIISYVWFAERYRQLRLVTAMDAIRMRFGQGSEQFFTWLNFISTLAIAAVWLVSLSIILSSAFHFPQWKVVCLTGAIVSLIAVVGGNWAVVSSDFVRLIVLLAVTTTASVLTIVRLGGVGAFLAQIPASHWQMFHRAGSIPYDWLYLVTGLLSATYMKNNFGYAAKYIAAKDGAEARRSALIPLIGYIVMPFIWFVPPLAAFTLAPNLAEHSLQHVPGESAYIAVILRVLPNGLMGLMIATMFSATIASMDVALNKNAGFFVKNFYQPLLRPSASDEELVVAGEISTVVFGLQTTALAFAIATATNVSLFDAFLYLNAYIGVPLCLPMFLGMLVKRVPVWAGWATTTLGILTTIFFYEFAPTSAGDALLRPILGHTAYFYILSNKFVITHLVTVPCCVLFFLSTRFAFRSDSESPYTRAVDAFFARMNTPVDFEIEVGNDETPSQARLLGWFASIYAIFVALLLFVPKTMTSRLGIAGCAIFIGVVGFGLLRYSRRLERMAG